MDHLHAGAGRAARRDVPRRCCGRCACTRSRRAASGRRSTCWTSRCGRRRSVARADLAGREGLSAGGSPLASRAGAGGARRGAAPGRRAHRGAAGAGRHGRDRGRGDDRRCCVGAGAPPGGGGRRRSERGARCCARLALLAEADPARLAEALALWSAGRWTRSAARRRGARVARAGAAPRAAARLGARRRAGAAACRAGGRGAARRAPSARPGWRLGAALARYRLGASERATTLIEAALRRRSAIRRPAGDRPARITWRPGAGRRAPGAAGSPSRADRAIATGRPRCRGSARTSPSITRATTRRRPRATAACWRRGRPIRWRWPRWSASPRARGDARRRCSWRSAAVGRAEDPGERAALAVRAAELNETAVHDLPRAAAAGAPGAGGGARLRAGGAPAGTAVPALERWDEHAKVVRSTAAADVGVGRRRGSASAGRGAAAGARWAPLTKSGWATRARRWRSIGEWVELGDAPAGGAAARCCAPPRRPAMRWSPPKRRSSSAPRSPGFADDARFAWRYRAATHLRRARGRRRRRRSAPTRPRWRWRPGSRPALAGLARAPPARAKLRGAGRRAVAPAAYETNPARASALEVEAAHDRGRAWGARRRRWRRWRARWRSTQPTWAPSTTTRACCSAWGAPTSWRRRWARWPRRWATPRQGGDRIAARPRSSSGSCAARARRWRPSSAPLGDVDQSRASGRQRHRGADPGAPVPDGGTLGERSRWAPVTSPRGCWRRSARAPSKRRRKCASPHRPRAAVARSRAGGGPPDARLRGSGGRRAIEGGRRRGEWRTGESGARCWRWRSTSRCCASWDASARPASCWSSWRR